MKTNKKKPLAPLPLFDALEYISKQVSSAYLSPTQKNDFLMAVSFLKGSVANFYSG